MFTQFLGTVATVYGVLGALKTLLQTRQMLARHTLPGSAMWLTAGFGSAGPAPQSSPECGTAVQARLASPESFPPDQRAPPDAASAAGSRPHAWGICHCALSRYQAAIDGTTNRSSGWGIERVSESSRRRPARK
jgi:hypothetical protein